MLLDRFVSACGIPGLTLGCAKGDAPPPDEGAGGEAPTGLEAYAHRRVIKLSPSTPDDYAIAFEIDHAALVAGEISLGDGSDVRVVYETEDETIEIDRVLEPASSWNDDHSIVWFRTRGPGTHYVYYGEDEPEPVLSDPARVFDAFEDFDGEALPDGWTLHEIGSASGSASVSDGAARVSGSAGDIGGTGDDMLLLAKEMTGDFTVDISIRGIGGSLGAGAKAGGLMVRQSPLADARFAMIGLVDAPRQRMVASRPVDGESVASASIDIPEAFPQLFSIERRGDAFSTWFSDDGVNWVSIGDTTTVEMLNPVLVGFPLANLSAGSANIEVDYVRERTIVLPTPTADLGAEEAL